MIIRSLTRRPGAIHSFARRASRAPVARYKHTVPTLLNHAELKNNGVPGLLSKEGFNIAYTQYQEHLLDQLNAYTSGTPEENTPPQALAVNFARDPEAAPIFNFASMAFNSHFFFRGLNTNPNVTSAPSADLLPLINENFTSLDALKETFLNTADAMFGPGFVWLVQSNTTSHVPLRILTTYLAGSPLSGAHYRRQAVDMNTQNPDSVQQLNSAGSFGAAAKATEAPRPKKPLGGVDVTPLLCVNTWEHAWLHDYGIKGKREYLERWWATIDWELVRQYVQLPQNQAKSAKQGSRNFYYS